MSESEISSDQFSQETKDLLLMTDTPLDPSLVEGSSFLTSQDVAELFTMGNNEPKIEELSSSGHHYATRQILVEEENVSRNLRSSKHIPMDDMPGAYGFKLFFEQKEKYAKNHPSCYSKAHNMLIVKAESSIPFQMISSCDMRQLYLTVVAVYNAPEHHETPVMNCRNHGAGNKQFISCTNPEAQDRRMGQRACISLPLRDLRDISNHSGTSLLENFVFNCRSSCTTDSSEHGINGRKLALIFTLEDSCGTVIGRSKVYLKVSVSPGRDILNLERGPSSKRRRTDSDRSGGTTRISKAIGGKYSVVCHDKRSYETVISLADGMNCLDDPDLYLETLKGSQGSMPASGEKGKNGTYTLESWLARYCLEQYAIALETGGYTTPQKLQSLEEKDMDRLNITDRAHRRFLQHAITNLGLKKFVKDHDDVQSA